MPGYLNFFQSPDQTRQLTKELFAPPGRLTGCPRTVFLVGGKNSLPEFLAQGKAEVTVWNSAQAVGQVPSGAPGRASEHLRRIIMGGECQWGQKSDSSSVGFGTRYTGDYLLM